MNATASVWMPRTTAFGVMFALICALLVAPLAGCGNGTETSAPDADTAEVAVEPDADAPAATEDASGEPAAEAHAPLNGDAAALEPAHAEPGMPAPPFTLTGSDGATYSLDDFRGQWVILEWINHDCPFVVKFYRPGKMQELQRTYTEQGAAWLSIASSAPGKQGHESPERWNELTEEKEAAPTAVLIDEDGTVGRTYRATNTPHMYVIDPEGTLVYMGAIDNIRSARPGDVDRADNYLVMVMDAVLEGDEPPITYTDAYGCAVHYAD